MELCELPPNPVSLTERQKAVLERVYDGSPNKQIAHDLKCSEVAVKAVLQQLFKKFGVRKRILIMKIAHKRALGAAVPIQ
jgi:DNA-binding NarL/FixJ family response regulator